MKKILIPLAALILIAAGIYAYRNYKSHKPFVLSGTIEARDVEVGSLVGGRVLEVNVEEGARVTAGQQIVRLQPDLLDLQISQQQAKIAEARANLIKMQ